MIFWVSDPNQSNPIHGWIQSMYNSVRSTTLSDNNASYRPSLSICTLTVFFLLLVDNRETLKQLIFSTYTCLSAAVFMHVVI